MDKKRHFKIDLIKEKFIQIGKTNCYAEDAFNVISDALQLYPLYINEEFCLEIDTISDLEKVKNTFFNDTNIISDRC